MKKRRRVEIHRLLALATPALGTHDAQDTIAVACAALAETRQQAAADTPPCPQRGVDLAELANANRALRPRTGKGRLGRSYSAPPQYA